MNDHEGGQNYLQGRVRGEPFYKDAEDFTSALELKTRQGQDVMEKM